jgi:hypothetical protein
MGDDPLKVQKFPLTKLNELHLKNHLKYEHEHKAVSLLSIRMIK